MMRICSNKSSDFYEGGRAFFIDKDRKPKWNPDSLEKVSDAAIESLFEISDRELNLKELESVNYVQSKL